MSSLLRAALSSSCLLTLLAATANGQTAADRRMPVLDASGGGASARIAEAIRVPSGSVSVDGRLDEEVWSTAPYAESFVQMRPAPGEPATERTQAWILYDEQAIYVGMRMHDREPDEIAAQLARRDASGIHSDWAHVLIDSYGDRRTAFRFSVNPRGVLKDVLHHDDTQEDVNWDAVWSASVSRDSTGWTAEFRIPLSQLRFSAGEGEQRWGINFGREIARHGEWSWWAPVLPTSGGMVSQAGELRGLTDLRSARRLELLPYSVASVNRSAIDAANPFRSPTQGGLSFGADLKYGLSSNLTLSGTVNPDFGQVEADPSVVNLGAFETFFPEKRPFFIEGSNIFSFGIGTDDNSGEQLFYSRRIGRAPQRTIEAGDGFVDAPDATTILGAAKLSGRTGSGWTLGALTAVTGAEHARVADAAGQIRTEAVEPLANYSVFSLSRDFAGGYSTIGALATATHRDLGDGEAFEFLRDAAYSGGVMGRHRFAGGTWQATGYLAGSHIRGSEESIARVQRGAGHYFQRPDAEHLVYDPTRTSLSGAIANVWVGKIGGSKLRGGLGGHLRTPGLELNDVGFQSGADQALAFGNLFYNQFTPGRLLRSWNLGLNPSVGFTTGGERTWGQIGHWANWELHNFWNGGWWMGRRFEGLDVGALRGGPAIVRPSGLRYSSWLNSDRRRPVLFNANVWGGAPDETGRWDVGGGVGATLRPSAQISLSLQPNYNRNEDPWQYVAQPRLDGQPIYLFGHLTQRTASLTTRLNYTASPTLSLQLYAQPFVSAGEYRGFSSVADPRAPRFEDRLRPIEEARLHFDAGRNRFGVDADGDGASDVYFNNPNFNVKQLRGNAVVRWEYAPGSTLFLVWSQGRSDRVTEGSFDARRDFGRLLGFDENFPIAGTNTLMLKLNYWVNF